ncbi:uncharacterized protein [Elaeis guineensis]|uniref:uncharacterized protein isoform X1 n=1 Tax=Elaeis guineensis var. tenera TaxID=51953 RepID=UPI003C6D79FC
MASLCRSAAVSVSAVARSAAVRSKILLPKPAPSRRTASLLRRFKQAHLIMAMKKCNGEGKGTLHGVLYLCDQGLLALCAVDSSSFSVVWKTKITFLSLVIMHEAVETDIHF